MITRLDWGEDLATLVALFGSDDYGGSFGCPGRAPGASSRSKSNTYHHLAWGSRLSYYEGGLATGVVNLLQEIGNILVSSV